MMSLVKRWSTYNLRRSRWYSMHYPMNTYQMLAHRNAMNRVIAEWKEKRPKKHLTQKKIEAILNGMGIFMRHAILYMPAWNTPQDPTSINFTFGYLQKTYTRRLHEMNQRGEFSKEEWKVIREEFYKPDLDIFYRLEEDKKKFKIKKQQEWQKKRKSK